MKGWNAANLAMQLSWTLLFSLAIPLLAGIWLDAKTGMSPLFTLVGVVLGILAATVGVVRMVIRMFSRAAAGPPEHPTEEGGEEEPS